MNSATRWFQLDSIVQGSGPSVILIHGMGASRYDWAALLPQLASAGYRAYAVDLLGHGDSPKPQDPALYTVETIYRALEDWIEQLDAPAPYHLVGHSLGGYLSIQYGLLYAHKVRAMTLIDPLYSSRQIHPILRYLSRSPGVGVKLLPYIPQHLIDAVLGWDPVTSAQFSPEARLQTVLDIKRASPHILHIPRSVADLTPKLAQVEQPCQVIWGEKDLTLSPDSFQPLVSTLPRASGYAIPGTGHQPHVGVPEIVNALVLDFVARSNGAAG